MGISNIVSALRKENTTSTSFLNIKWHKKNLGHLERHNKYQKSKSDFPPYFVEHGDKICGSKTIADKFNEYFTKIGPELASSIDTSHMIPFNDYLKSPC